MTDGRGVSSRLMARAFELARSVRGFTSPNPAVGAVVVFNGTVVGEGATQPPGGPHAEVIALAEAGPLAQGATLYVTLEPCAHYGRTPPCTDAILQSGAASVVAAVRDPDTQVAGRGLEQLRSAGLDVTVGDGAVEGSALYEAYAHHRRSGRPFVTAKFAASMDGRIAATSGDSRWVSGPQTLRWAHQQRPLFDAMLVGVETVLVDDPQLSARPQRWQGRIPQPLRVVLDSRGRTTLDRRVLSGLESSRTLLATTESSLPAWRESLRDRGVDVAVMPSDAGRVSLPALLDRLGAEYGVVSLLVEGGGEVLGSFFDQRLINKVTAVIAPIIIGGDAQTAVRGGGAERMRDALRLSGVRFEQLGGDLLVTGYPNDPEREHQVQIRPAGPPDGEAVDELLAAHGQLALTLSDLLTEARSGEASVWLALIPQETVDGRDLVVGLGAVSFADSSRASLRCLVARPDAASSIVERLLGSCEASASGRGCEWVSWSESIAPSLTREQAEARGYRYFRRDPDGGSVYIRRLSD